MNYRWRGSNYESLVTLSNLKHGLLLAPRYTGDLFGTKVTHHVSNCQAFGNIYFYKVVKIIPGGVFCVSKYAGFDGRGVGPAPAKVVFVSKPLPCSVFLRLTP